MRAYVSGPTAGLPDLNQRAFEDAAFRLRAVGYAVATPHEIVGGCLRETFEGCAAAVLDSDVLVALEGWEDSPSAATEVLVAEAHARPVLTLDAALRCGYLTHS